MRIFFSLLVEKQCTQPKKKSKIPLSGAKEIPVHFSDGRPSPKPLRSVDFPEGLPDLPHKDAVRVHRDNVAANFVLDEIHNLAQIEGWSYHPREPWAESPLGVTQREGAHGHRPIL